MENDAAYWKGRIANLTPIADGMAVALALCLRDDSLDAEQVLATAREDVQTPIRALPPDGSWPESVNYWGVFLHGLIFYGAVMETATGTDDGVFALPGVRNAGWFPMYFTPRGVPAGYNDGMNAGACPFMHLLAERFDLPAWTHWADAYAGTEADGSNRSSDWYTILWRSTAIPFGDRAVVTEAGDLPAPKRLADAMSLDTMKVYDEVRWAALASSWPHPELYVSFKSGYAAPGFGHTSRDLNAIQVICGGEPLIRRSHDYRTPPSGYSTILIDGEAQQAGNGTILYREQADRFRVIAAEADRSFGPEVTRVRRHVVMVDGRYLVVLDEVAAERPVRITFVAHTPGELEPGYGACAVVGRKTNLGLRFVGPEVQLATVDPPPCVMTQLTRAGLHATTHALTGILLATVVWPKAEEVAVPNCRWRNGLLEVERPDGASDQLVFGDREEAFGFRGLV
jgi:hypothetical protein